MGEGSAQPTDTQHTPTFDMSSPKPENTQKPRQPKRKTTKVPQPSESTNIAAYEAVHKERGDNMAPRTMRDTSAHTRVISSSADEALDKEDTSKHRRIDEIDANEDITLVKTHDDVSTQDTIVQDKGIEDVSKEEVVELQLTDAEKTKLFMEFIEKRRKFFAAKKDEEKRNKPSTKAQQRSIMSTYLKNMDVRKIKALKNKSFAKIQELFDKAMKRINNFVDFRTELVEESTKKDEAEITQESKLKQCLEIIPDDGDDVTIDATPLSSKLVKAKFEKVQPVDNMDSFLLHNLKTTFAYHVEDNVWKIQQGLTKVKNWKLFYSCKVHCVTMQNILYYLLVEKMYPLTHHTLHQMFNEVKLQVDYECEMAYELLRLVKKQLKEGYVPQ
nr:hypothetical protein [Tanacetum cinerariifolium]